MLCSNPDPLAFQYLSSLIAITIRYAHLSMHCLHSTFMCQACCAAQLAALAN